MLVLLKNRYDHILAKCSEEFILSVATFLFVKVTLCNHDMEIAMSSSKNVALL